MIKIEIIILSIIAVVSFIIGVIINIIDIYKENTNNKDKDNTNSFSDVLSITKTLMDFGLPQVEEYEDPVIIKTIEVEEDKDK